MKVKVLKDITVLCVKYKEGDEVDFRDVIAIDLEGKGYVSIIEINHVNENVMPNPENKEKRLKKTKHKELDI